MMVVVLKGKMTGGQMAGGRKGIEGWEHLYVLRIVQWEKEGGCGSVEGSISTNQDGLASQERHI